jgi:hypothetical protein
MIICPVKPGHASATVAKLRFPMTLLDFVAATRNTMRYPVILCVLCVLCGEVKQKF